MFSSQVKPRKPRGHAQEKEAGLWRWKKINYKKGTFKSSFNFSTRFIPLQFILDFRILYSRECFH